MKSKFLQTAIKAVKNAEEVILKYYQRNQGVKIKADSTPVTLADKEAEKVIIQTIKQYFPEHGFLGEEYGSKTSASEYVWIIDPIDGTKNYTRHIPLFGTLLVLSKKGKIILGVSNAPLMKELMYAERGKGSFLNGKKVGVSKVSNLSQAYLFYGNLNDYDRPKLLKDLTKLCSRNILPRGISDLWGYHLLDQGRADVVIDKGVHIWDIAASSIIVEEAGGRVTDFRGGSIDIHSRDAVATNNKLHRTVLSYFK